MANYLARQKSNKSNISYRALTIGGGYEYLRKTGNNINDVSWVNPSYDTSYKLLAKTSASIDGVQWQTVSVLAPNTGNLGIQYPTMRDDDYTDGKNRLQGVYFKCSPRGNKYLFYGRYSIPYKEVVPPTKGFQWNSSKYRFERGQVFDYTGTDTKMNSYLYFDVGNSISFADGSAGPLINCLPFFRAVKRVRIYDPDTSSIVYEVRVDTPLTGSSERYTYFRGAYQNNTVVTDNMTSELMTKWNTEANCNFQVVLYKD